MKNKLYKEEKLEKEIKRNYKKYLVFIIFFVVIILTNIVTYKLVKNGDIVIKKPDFAFLNPARAFVEQKDLIVNFQPLRDYLNDKYETNPDVSIYFEYLPTGGNIAINKDAEFFPASLLKTPLAMAVAKKVDKGEWKWDNRLVLMSSDKDDKFGTLYKEETNSTYTIEDLVKRSLSESDNTAHFILMRNLELSEIEDVYDHVGLKGFLDSNGKISAKKYSTILRSLYNSSYLKEENSQKLLYFLTQSKFNEYIQSGLPPDVVFAHKIGTAPSMFIDSGIVYLKDRPYILVIMVNIEDDKKMKEIMNDISKRVYNYVVEYKE